MLGGNEMIKTINHVEIGGGYTLNKEIIIDTAYIYGNYETMVLDRDGEELECCYSETEIEAEKQFISLFNKYAEPFQKAVYGKMEAGKKYTLVYFSEFGLPISQKITFESMECTTYAQHSDVIKMTFKPYRKKSMWQKYFYNNSLMIFEGWQNLDERATKTIISETETVKTMKSKYPCFDARYIDDLENFFKNPIVIYKNYKTDMNGKIYG